MKDWKTTAAAVVTALFGFIATSPEHFQAWPVIISLAKYIAAGGLVAFGVAAKDGQK